MEQVEQYGPPPNPAKEADTRFESYVKTFGTTECWELDSLNPAVIADLIRTEIEALIDQEAWRVAMAKEKRDRALLEATTENWTEVENLLEGDR